MLASRTFVPPDSLGPPAPGVKLSLLFLSHNARVWVSFLPIPDDEQCNTGIPLFQPPLSPGRMVIILSSYPLDKTTQKAENLVVVVALQAGSIFWENKRAIFWYNKSWFSEKIRALIFYACTPKLIWGLSSRRINTAKMTAILARYFLIFTPTSDYHV